MPIRSILVAWDGSEPSRRALALAEDLAGQYSARLLLVTVLEPTPIPSGVLVPVSPFPTKEDVERTQQELQHLAKDLLARDQAHCRRALDLAKASIRSASIALHAGPRADRRKLCAFARFAVAKGTRHDLCSRVGRARIERKQGDVEDARWLSPYNPVPMRFEPGRKVVSPACGGHRATEDREDEILSRPPERDDSRGVMRNDPNSDH